MVGGKFSSHRNCLAGCLPLCANMLSPCHGQQVTCAGASTPEEAGSNRAASGA